MLELSRIKAVSLRDLRFSPIDLTMKSGSKVVISLRNKKILCRFKGVHLLVYGRMADFRLFITDDTDKIVNGLLPHNHHFTHSATAIEFLGTGDPLTSPVPTLPSGLTDKISELEFAQLKLDCLGVEPGIAIKKTSYADYM